MVLVPGRRGWGKSAWIQTSRLLGWLILGGRSSVRLEHLVVVQDVGGSNPLGHPNDGPSDHASRDVCTVRNRLLPISLGKSPRRHAPLAQLAEHRTLNPQVLGSSPRGRTPEETPGEARFSGRLGFRRSGLKRARGHTVVT